MLYLFNMAYVPQKYYQQAALKFADGGDLKLFFLIRVWQLFQKY